MSQKDLKAYVAALYPIGTRGRWTIFIKRMANEFLFSLVQKEVQNTRGYAFPRLHTRSVRYIAGRHLSLLLTKQIRNEWKTNIAWTRMQMTYTSWYINCALRGQPVSWEGGNYSPTPSTSSLYTRRFIYSGLPCYIRNFKTFKCKNKYKRNRPLVCWLYRIHLFGPPSHLGPQNLLDTLNMTSVYIMQLELPLAVATQSRGLHPHHMAYTCKNASTRLTFASPLTL